MPDLSLCMLSTGNKDRAMSGEEIADDELHTGCNPFFHHD
jgi:hypothetical protein